jgi:hypothetical protein
MPNLFPMSLRGHALEAYDLRRLSAELSTQASCLFLQEGVASRLEVREYIPGAEDQGQPLPLGSVNRGANHENGGLSALHFISSTDELRMVLEVSSSASK